MFSKTAIDILNKSDFSNRFLDFVKRYENFRNVAHNSIFSSWVEENNYDYIRSYLSASLTDDSVPFTLTDFVSMSGNQIAFWHDYCLELKYLLDEKKALYENLNQYYQPS